MKVNRRFAVQSSAPQEPHIRDIAGVPSAAYTTSLQDWNEPKGMLTIAPFKLWRSCCSPLDISLLSLPGRWIRHSLWLCGSRSRSPSPRLCLRNPRWSPWKSRWWKRLGLKDRKSVKNVTMEGLFFAPSKNCTLKNSTPKTLSVFSWKTESNKNHVFV